MSGGPAASTREAWCRALWVDPLRRLAGAGVECVFVRGDFPGPPGAAVRRGDTLWVAAPDDYAGLPDRTRALARYAAAAHPDAAVFKCDDDTYACPPRLLALAAGLTHDYVGFDWRPCAIGRGLPRYAHGGAGYLLSARAARLLADLLPPGLRGAEDLAVGRVLELAGVRLAHDRRFNPDWDPARVPAPSNDMITAHRVDTADRAAHALGLWGAHAAADRLRSGSPPPDRPSLPPEA